MGMRRSVSAEWAGEERKATDDALAGCQKVVHFLGSDGALQLLAVQQPLLNPVKGFASLDELLRTFPVAAAVAGLPGRNKVSANDRGARSIHSR